MPWFAWLAVGAIVLSALHWFYACWAACRLWRAIPRLVPPAALPPGGWPRISVIVPACDEAEHLEAAVRSRLADDYPDFEVIVVDDRSTDGTGAIADRLAADDARVRALHVTELPDGWLGKVHAMERAREAATGEWLLFTDADVHVRPGSLRAAVDCAERLGADHLAVMPAIWRGPVLLDIAIATFGRLLSVAGRLWAVPNPRSSAFCGIGAFNLVRRDAFANTRGFEWLRMEAVDDIALGRMMKLAGQRSAVATALDLVGLHFYGSLGEMAGGMEKNAFAVAGRYRWWRLCGAVAAWAVADFGIWAAAIPTLPPWSRLLGVAGLLAALAALVALARWTHRPVFSALCYPVGTLLVMAMMLRAAWLTTLRGGVAWRGTLYPIAALRAGQRLFGRP